MPKTEQNLQGAFAGESQANRKYLAFAAKADQEGFPRAAELFRAGAEAENGTAHASLIAPKKLTAITCAPFAAIPPKKKHRKPARCAAPKARCLRKLIKNF